MPDRVYLPSSVNRFLSSTSGEADNFPEGAFCQTQTAHGHFDEDGTFWNIMACIVSPAPTVVRLQSINFQQVTSLYKLLQLNKLTTPIKFQTLDELDLTSLKIDLLKKNSLRRLSSANLFTILTWRTIRYTIII